MANHPYSSRNAPSSRPTRGATSLRQLMVRRNSGERTPMDVNVITGVASGQNADVFRSYIGVLARDKINILTPSFDHVCEIDRNIIRNDLRYRKLEEKILKKKAEDHRAPTLLRLHEKYPKELEKPEGSCSASAVLGDDIDDASPCLLYVLDGNETMLVARGIVFQAATVVHGLELSEDAVKVLVDYIIILDASVPLPTDDIFTMAQAFQSLSFGLNTWLVMFLTPPVEYHPNVFVRGSKVPMYLHSQDVKELASGREELNITLIQLWMMYMFGVSNNLGYNDVYGFIDPQDIHEANNFDDIITYLTNNFARRKNLYFIPYIFGTYDVGWEINC
ncbi:hypothetical protein LR48_Vigan11g076400 [Vigna angularis]|uniref:DUF8039 domain-containing protein n=1 Tax=Phaseolus angularis TaxID=3914 RepID=A0A0L9VRM5_PHAAN|nr:hypothetical protein LR48_Vigan11g076400 [Vigna angularis]